MDEAKIREFNEKEEDKWAVADALVNKRRVLWDNCRTGEQQRALRVIFDDIDRVKVLRKPQGTFDGRAHMINKISHLVGTNVICVGDGKDFDHVNDIIGKARWIDDQQKLEVQTPEALDATDPEFEKVVADHIAGYVYAYNIGEYHPETKEMQDQLELMHHVLVNPDDLVAKAKAKQHIQEIAAEYKVHFDDDSADRIMAKLKIYADVQYPEEKTYSYQKDLMLSNIQNVEGPSAPVAAPPLNISCPNCGNDEISPMDIYCGKCGAKVV